MWSRRRLAAIAAAALAPASLAHAAADLAFRESLLQHVCKGGTVPAGTVCCKDADCGTNGTCVVDYVGKRLTGTLTLVIDDDVSNLNGDRISNVQVRAVTTILEFKGKGLPLLAQIFENLAGNDFSSLVTSLSTGPTDQFGFDSREGLLAQNVQPGGAGTALDVSFLFFRMVDQETQNALRVAAGLPPTGPEELVVQLDKASPIRFENHFSPATPGDNESHDNDPFASVLEAKVTLRYVAPKPPQC